MVAVGGPYGDVHVHDVTLLQLLAVVGDAVADHVVDRGADRLGKAVIVERRRGGAELVDDVVVAQLVQVACADAGFHVGGDHLQHTGGLAAGFAHLLDFFGRLDGYVHGISVWVVSPRRRRLSRVAGSRRR